MCNSASDADCDGGGPGSASSARPQADGMWTGPIVTMFSKWWQCVYVLYITSLRTKVLKEELLTTETTNDERGWGSRRYR